MFTRRCTTCTRRQLIFPSQLIGVESHAHGMSISYRCWCGSEQSFVTDVVDDALLVAA